MLKLWVKDNTTGKIHEYGTDKHDALVLQEDGSLHYEHLQCGVGTMFPEEGFSFCDETGVVPDLGNMDEDGYIDIGGIGVRAKEPEADHAQWVRVEDECCFWYECSACGEEPAKIHGNCDFFSPFCPHCGRPMSGVRG